MSDLTDRADSRLNQARGDRLSSEVATTQDKTPKPTIFLGMQGDRALVQTIGENPTANGVLITNGGIPNGGLVQRHGNSVNAMPRVKRVVPPSKYAPTTGRIKIVFYLPETRQIRLGGDRLKPQTILTLPEGVSLSSLHLSNTGRGKNDWIVGLQYGSYNDRYSGQFFTQTIAGNGAGWILSTPLSSDTVWRGNGYWISSFSGTNNYGSAFNTILGGGGSLDGVFISPRVDYNIIPLLSTMIAPPYLSGLFTNGIGSSTSKSFSLFDGAIEAEFNGASMAGGGGYSYTGDVIIAPEAAKPTFETLTGSVGLPVRDYVMYSTLLTGKSLADTIFERKTPSTQTYYYRDNTTEVETLLPDGTISATIAPISLSNLVGGNLYAITQRAFDVNGKAEVKTIAMSGVFETGTKKEPYFKIDSNASSSIASYHP